MTNRTLLGLTADWLNFHADSIGIASVSLVLLAPMIVTFLKAQA